MSSTSADFASARQILQEISSLREIIASMQGKPLSSDNAQFLQMSTIANSALKSTEVESLTNRYISWVPSKYGDEQSSPQNGKQVEEEPLAKEFEEGGQLWDSFFFVLFEWYKTGEQTLQQLLLRHLPVILLSHFAKEQNPIVNGALLCIYNVEILLRRNMKPDEKKQKLFCRAEHITAISSSSLLYANEHIMGMLNSQKTLSLTPSVLKAQEKPAEIPMFVKPGFEDNLPFIQDIKPDFAPNVLCVAMQAFARNLPQLGTLCLLDFCSMSKQVAIACVPFTVPTYYELLLLSNEKGSNTQANKPAAVQQEPKASAVTLVPEPPTLPSSSQLELELEDIKPVTLPVPKLHHLQLLNEYIASNTCSHAQHQPLQEQPPQEQPPQEQPPQEQLQKPKSEAINSSNSNGNSNITKLVPRTRLSSPVQTEMLNVIRYCAFNLKDPICYESLYALYMRSQYDQTVETSMYTQALLSQL